MRRVKTVGIILGVLVGVFLVMQIIPYGRTHTNPPTTREPAWDSPRTRELAVRACFDCHSNNTAWPWYANVAPFSWAVQFDVEIARGIVNYSQMDSHFPTAVYSGQRTRDGNMPPSKYMLAHPGANLTDAERKELADGLDRTLGNSDSRPSQPVVSQQ